MRWRISKSELRVLLASERISHYEALHALAEVDIENQRLRDRLVRLTAEVERLRSSR